MGKILYEHYDFGDEPLLSDESSPVVAMPKEEEISETLDDVVAEAINEIFNEIDADDG